MGDKRLICAFSLAIVTSDIPSIKKKWFNKKKRRCFFFVFNDMLIKMFNRLRRISYLEVIKYLKKYKFTVQYIRYTVYSI